LFIRSFIYSEINTFRLSKLSKISFACNIFVPIPMQEMVYLKAIQKSAPMGVSVSGTTDQKTYLKKFRGESAPLVPPGSAYDDRLPICSNVRMVSVLVSFLCFLLIQAKKQETFRKGGWLLYCIAFQ